MIVKGEGLIRMEAERLFTRRCKAEYEDLCADRGHVEALKVLVAKRKKDYDTCVRDARDTLASAVTPAPASVAGAGEAAA